VAAGILGAGRFKHGGLFLVSHAASVGSRALSLWQVLGAGIALGFCGRGVCWPRLGVSGASEWAWAWA
jgi:hypothetical protein